MEKFPSVCQFDGRIYKLATMGKGITWKEAGATVKINEAEGNFILVVGQGGKYAVYVKKVTWKNMR